jgi:hypothetical protein
MNVCTICSENFGSVAAFDAHRVGNYLQKGRAEYVGSLEDWTPSKGRRCLTVVELVERGFETNAFGAWSFTRDLENRHAALGVRQDATHARRGTPERVRT